ncbi:MAG: hypothetical protein Q8P76_04110 [bacterium]|nr:hypothetical protein [bacterium]
MRNERGQVMLLTVLLLSGTILSATTIAGLLMLYQIRQATDIANSTKAIYAADTGIERRVYDIFLDPDGLCSLSEPSLDGTLDNGAAFQVACDKQTQTNADGSKTETITIRSTGNANKNYRALETVLARDIPPPPPPLAP